MVADISIYAGVKVVISNTDNPGWDRTHKFFTKPKSLRSPDILLAYVKDYANAKKKAERFTDDIKRSTQMEAFEIMHNIIITKAYL